MPALFGFGQTILAQWCSKDYLPLLRGLDFLWFLQLGRFLQLGSQIWSHSCDWFPRRIFEFCIPMGENSEGMRTHIDLTLSRYGDWSLRWEGNWAEIWFRSLNFQPRLFAPCSQKRGMEAVCTPWWVSLKLASRSEEWNVNLIFGTCFC